MGIEDKLAPMNNTSNLNGMTPAAAGYSMPAEWKPHQCTWISWPHNRESWPDKFEPVEPAMARFVGVLSQTELVRINVLGASHEKHVRQQLEGYARFAGIAFHHKKLLTGFITTPEIIYYLFQG